MGHRFSFALLIFYAVCVKERGREGGEKEGRERKKGREGEGEWQKGRERRRENI